MVPRALTKQITRWWWGRWWWWWWPKTAWWWRWGWYVHPIHEIKISMKITIISVQSFSEEGCLAIRHRGPERKWKKQQTGEEDKKEWRQGLRGGGDDCQRLIAKKKWAAWLKGFSKWAEHLRVLRGRWTLNTWESWMRGTVCCDPGRPCAPLLRAWELPSLFGSRLEGGVGARLLQKWGEAELEALLIVRRHSHPVRQPDETLWFVTVTFF